MFGLMEVDERGLDLPKALPMLNHATAIRLHNAPTHTISATPSNNSLK